MADDGGLLGRGGEQHRLAALLSGARGGRGGALVVLGEPGMGKTALLDDALTGSGLRLVRLDGYESESAMPFAAVQRLVLMLRDQVDTLPHRQRQAVLVASALAEGPPPDRFLVGLGLLGILTAQHAADPVVCAVDDAHLIDHESLDALAFVARRVTLEHAAVVFAARDERGIGDRVGGVPRLVLSGLSVEDSVQLLNRSSPASVPPSSAVAIARATGGNPLALIDLAGEALVHELVDVGLSGEPVPVGRHLEAHYVRQVRRLDPQVQAWILLAAADSTGNTDLVTEGASVLGLDLDGGNQAEVAGLVELVPAIRFRHPLVRSAVYGSAPAADRRRVHGALARAAVRLGMTETEAWHAGRSVVGTDPAVADRLERSADLAARRGGLGSRASILTRAADLTPPGPDRGARRVAAAEAALAVGAAHAARRLLDGIGPTDADAVTRGRMMTLRSALALFVSDPDGVRAATAQNLAAAEEFHGRDPVREQHALLRAFESACTAERLMVGVSQDELGRRLAAGADVHPGPAATILRALGAVVLEPYERAVPLARTAFRTIGDLPEGEAASLGSITAALGTFLWDDVGRAGALARASRHARDQGALQMLDILLWVMALSELWGGTVRRSVRYDELVREVRSAMGYDAEGVVNVALMAWTGQPRDVVLAVVDGVDATGFGGVSASALASLAVRDLAEGRYGDAYALLSPQVADPFLHVTQHQYPDYVEAAVRCGRRDDAVWATEVLADRARANGSAWCRGVAERALALTSPDGDAEQHFRLSVQALTGSPAEVDLARTHLLYGEWLRRRRRRREAVEHLRTALEHFRHGGADLFLARTVSELEAAGGRDAVEAPRPQFDLTPTELRIARLAAAGRTNSEIAANLFISPNTVDYHLRKVFQKLSVTSRRQVAERLQAGS